MEGRPLLPASATLTQPYPCPSVGERGARLFPKGCSTSRAEGRGEGQQFLPAPGVLPLLQHPKPQAGARVGLRQALLWVLRGRAAQSCRVSCTQRQGSFTGPLPAAPPPQLYTPRPARRKGPPPAWHLQGWPRHGHDCCPRNGYIQECAVTDTGRDPWIVMSHTTRKARVPSELQNRPAQEALAESSPRSRKHASVWKVRVQRGVSRATAGGGCQA